MLDSIVACAWLHVACAMFCLLSCTSVLHGQCYVAWAVLCLSHLCCSTHVPCRIKHEALLPKVTIPNFIGACVWLLLRTEVCKLWQQNYRWEVAYIASNVHCHGHGMPHFLAASLAKLHQKGSSTNLQCPLCPRYRPLGQQPS